MSSSQRQKVGQQLTQQLRRAGLDPQFVRRRLSPSGGDERTNLGSALDLAARVHRILARAGRGRQQRSSIEEPHP